MEAITKVGTEVAAGNSKLPPLKKRKRTYDNHQEAKYKTWVFTIPNYTDMDIQALRDLSNVKKLIWGKEVAPTTGMKHLQCAVTWAQGKRFTQMQKNFPRWHNIQPAKSIDDAFNYCMKEADYELIDNSKKGSRTDLLKAAEMIKSKQSWKDVITEPQLYEVNAKYPKWVQEQYESKPQPKLWNPEHKLWKWQQQVVDKLNNPPVRREIIWVVDRETGNGKSSLSDYIEENFQNVQYFTNAKSADVAMALDNPKIVIFDFALDQQERINYEIIECVKNGKVFSGKYHSCLKKFPIPHIIVFANRLPDTKRIAENRLVIIDTFDRYD